MRDRPLIDKPTFVLLWCLVRVLRLLPLPLVRWLGASVGGLLYYMVPGRRKIGLANLDTVYGDRLSRREKRRIARKSAKHFLESALVFTRCYWWSREKLDGLMDAQSIARLDERLAREDGKGLIIVSGHLSNFPLVIVYLRQWGMPVAAEVRRGGFKPVEQMLDRIRDERGVSSLARGSTAVRARRLLEDGGVIWSIIDQDARPGVLVDFFGKPATTYPTAVRLARAFDVPILPLFVRQNEAGKYVLDTESVIRLPHGKPTGDELVAELRHLNGLLEQHILRTPEQWLWTHRRWRTAEKTLRRQQSVETT